MNRNAFKIFILFLLTTTSCQQKNTSKELIERFYLNKVYFDSLITSLNNDKRLDSLFWIEPDKGLPDIGSNYPKEFRLIKKLGITDASSHSICNRCPRWYYLKTNWPDPYPIYFIYNYKYNNDSSENIKGFYKIDNHKNETWGLGNNWKMSRLVETNKDIKQ